MEKIDSVISIRNLNKKYEDKIIFENFNIDFVENKVNCIIGKSGCGKSTLLNLISGIIKSDSDKFETLEKEGLSYIFQEDRLIDWLTVKENLSLVVNKIYNKEKVEKLCNKYLELVGINDYKDYYPQMLSGGMRQRVNIARALIYPSKTIIMDEPFKSIDVVNKEIIINNLKEILEAEKRTVLFVTHDIDEAILLAHKIYILGDEPVLVKQIFNNNNISKEEIYNLI